MSTRDEPWPDGTPCWYDVVTTDRAPLWAFYAAVFGWEIADQGEQFGHYAVALVGARSVAGIGEGPVVGTPAWTTYLATSDLDATLAKVAGNGGTVVMPAMDIAESGRMALATDPNGALFGLWQAMTMVGAALVNEPGGVVWNDNVSHDPARAREFYTALFGYTYNSDDEGTPEYTTIDGAGPGNTIGGIGTLGEGDAGPARWNTYFAVADVPAVTAAAAAAGGTVVKEPFDTPFGQMAVLADPQGAVFTVGSGGEPA